MQARSTLKGMSSWATSGVDHKGSLSSVRLLKLPLDGYVPMKNANMPASIRDGIYHRNIYTSSVGVVVEHS